MVQQTIYSRRLQAEPSKVPFYAFASVSADSGASDWLRFTSAATELPDSDFINGLRFRLGQSVSLLPRPLLPTRCQAHASCSQIYSPGHEFVCDTANGGVCARHNQLRDCIASMVSSCGFPVVKEMKYGQGSNCRSDVAIRKDGIDHHADISVISIHAATKQYQRNAQASTLPQLKEKQKASDYLEKQFPARADQVLDVIAFTDVGQLGEKGQAFLQMVEKYAKDCGKHFVRRWWRARMGCILVNSIRLIVQSYVKCRRRRVPELLDSHANDDQTLAESLTSPA